MVRLLVRSTLVVAIVSCGRPPARTSVDRLTALADAGCACTTAACAARVRDDAATVVAAGRVTAAERPAFDAARARLEACLAHAPP